MYYLHMHLIQLLNNANGKRLNVQILTVRRTGKLIDQVRVSQLNRPLPLPGNSRTEHLQTGYR